jgi:hypothetical protein
MANAEPGKVRTGKSQAGAPCISRWEGGALPDQRGHSPHPRRLYSCRASKAKRAASTSAMFWHVHMYSALNGANNVTPSGLIS